MRVSGTSYCKYLGDIVRATHHKEGMSHDIISHISLNQKVMYAMSSQCPVEGVMDGTVPDIGTIHCAAQVEVDGISSQSKCLSHVTHFCVLNPEIESPTCMLLDQLQLPCQ